MTTSPTLQLPGTYLGADVRIDVSRTLEQMTIGLRDITVERGDGYPEVYADGDRRTVISYEGIGHFELTGGRHISVHPHPDCDPGAVLAAFHSGTPSLLLAQQGRFALHATTVDLGGVTVAIAGRSGAGKSTTSLALVGRGAQPVVDDVTVLDISEGRAMTQSFGRPAHVFPHVLEELGIAPSLARPLGRQADKVALDWPDVAPTPVDVVVVLRPGTVDRLELEQVSGAAAMRALHHVIHMRRLLRDTHGDRMFRWNASVASTVRVAILRRPAAGWPLDDLCDAVERFARSAADDDATRA